jgi:cell wall-associated NlpC family hydrolase
MCRCKCGTERDVLIQSLRRADRTNLSCGCWRQEVTKNLVSTSRWRNSHGAAAAIARGSDAWIVYGTWRRIRRRCDDQSNPYYGGRGITIYEPWQNDASAFISWVLDNLGPRPAGMSLDRVDNDGNYEPGNIQWATRSQQAKNRRSPAVKSAATFAALLAIIGTFFLAGSAPRAHAAELKPAATAAMTMTQRDAAAYRWALTQKGKWYRYGGTGPSTYDCSGLIYAAYLRQGHVIPRTTYGMLASRRLVRVAHPRAGDLAFFGSGHVEFYAGGHSTFGAHHTGTRLSYRAYDAYYHPTAFYRVV